ncbi:MAG: substrate-binding domain-containing protein [Oscillospiraceae bacterium]
MKKKLLALALASALALSLVGCAPKAPPEVSPSDTAVTDQPTTEKPYIAVVSKGFQHQFWQVVKKGAEQAAKDFNVEITFDGPPTESDIAIQVDMLKSAMDKKPNAVCLAALDTESVKEQLNAMQKAGIPVVGFDSGVPNAPEGSIYATASTDNAAAAALAAQHLFDEPSFKAALDAASADKPITVAVLSQDATSESIISRTSGFVDKLVELVGADNAKVIGHDKYAKDAAAAKLIINVNVTATTSATDMKSGAEALLGQTPIAIYGSNENAAGGILAASNDGNDFNKENGKFKSIIAIGFDAGKTQRTAVQNQWFLGSVTQDPYQIGYKAVSLAVDALAGKAAASPIVDTGAKWYNSENLSDPMISDLVYE